MFKTSHPLARSFGSSVWFHASETNSILLGAVLGARLSPLSLLPVCPGQRAGWARPVAQSVLGAHAGRRRARESLRHLSPSPRPVRTTHFTKGLGVSVAGPQPSRGGSVLSAHLMEEHLMAQRVGFPRGYPVSAKSQTLNLGPGVCCSTAGASQGESRGPGEAAALAVATSTCFSVLGLALGDLLG